MKFNWGVKITILYISFVLFMAGLVYLAMQQKIELIAPDYYVQELKFQQRIDANRNANALKQAIDITTERRSIVLSFPKEFNQENTKGIAYLFRASDASKDLKLPIQINTEGKQVIASPKLVKGMYNLQLSWRSAGKEYFITKDVFLN
ncbi:FixH family protein [Solitalea koreensis]|uniref:FixH protein n=1 Tax=Solitalea koreensis TaxID=543615 RepID=A0A521BF02_9SPHI|nr:FixH family protein [Solitalea koreensis]SMO45652.1 FixH protein [Solitalea koreensis]